MIQAIKTTNLRENNYSIYLQFVAGLLHLSSLMKKSQKFYIVIKTMIGILGAFVGILVLLPLLYWWVFIVNLFATKGHPIYVQKRVGKHKKVFGLLKFRSMRLDAPEVAPSDLTPEKQSAMETGFGKFLRKTSIDETLQLFNILICQMSFIGPRPGAAKNEDELIRLREQYTPNAFDVRPGLGGWAQLKNNRAHDPEAKARLDHEYVKNISLWLDIKIFILTVVKLFGSGKGQ